MHLIQFLVLIIRANVPLFLIKYILFPILAFHLTTSNPTFGVSLLLIVLLINMLAADSVATSDKIIKEKFGYTPNEFFIETHTKVIEKIMKEKEDDEDN